jgi:hypothetical protein
MDAREVAARFAAHVWYSEIRGANQRLESAEFAKRNWAVFLPIANEGLGRLLLRIGAPRQRARHRKMKLAPVLV